MTTVLAAQGVSLPHVEDEISEEGYTVRSGGVARQIYDASELERDASGDQLGLIWGLSMTRAFRLVDELLAAAGSSERLYAVNGGNDLFALFLTSELYKLIASQPGFVAGEGLYRPTEEYPWFGQPHE